MKYNQIFNIRALFYANIVLLFGYYTPLIGQNTLVPKTYFEIDGNKAVDTAPNGDWSGVYGVGTTPDSYITTGIYYNNVDSDPCRPDSDDIAGPGAVKVEDGPVWPSTPGSPSKKNDLMAFYIAAEKIDVNGQLNDILYVGVERCPGGTGTFSATIYLDDGDGLFPNDPVTDDTDGDFIITFDFQSGNTGIGFYKLISSSWVTQSIPVGTVDGAVDLNDPNNFGEVALNLTAMGIIPETDCITNHAVTGTGGTIAGGDINSSMKDLIKVTPLKISNCGNLKITKAREPSIFVSNDNFHYEVDQSDDKQVHDNTLDVSSVTGTAEADADLTEVDADIKIDETDTWGNVISQPDYKIVENTPPSPWNIGKIECTYTDIFQTGQPTVTTVMHDGTSYTSNTFLITPITYGNNTITPTSCTVTNKILVDFDDLPASFDGGTDPHTVVDPGLYIGSGYTDEINGWNSGTAVGDTDDGVTTSPFPKWVNGNTCSGRLADGTMGIITMGDDTYCFTVQASNGTGTAAQLVAWIDWNQNNTFDVGELSETVTDGSTGNVPAGANNEDIIVYWYGVSKIAGSSFARLRITTDASFKSSSSPNPTVVTTDGEIEGYFIDVGQLPVELSFFEATATNHGVELNWTTESEIENLGFIIERKTEGEQSWTEIASYKTHNILLGQGSVEYTNHYSYTDKFVEANTSYLYRLGDVDYEGLVTYYSVRKITVTQPPVSAKIEEFTVLPAYPNPFNPETIIRYGIPESESKYPVSVEIFDVSGRLINTLFLGEKSSGWYSVTWNGTYQNGTHVAAGVYLGKVSYGIEAKTVKLMLLK